MFNSSITATEQTSGVMRPIDYALAAESYLPTGLETAQASAAMAFDRTMGARWYENYQLQSEAANARKEGRAYTYKDETEWQLSEMYVPGIEYREGMTDGEAAILKGNHEKRRRWEAILKGADRNGNPWLYMPVSFGAGIMASFPDPVNLATMAIPGGAAVKSAMLGTTFAQGAKLAFKSSFTPGNIATAATANLASSAYAAYDLNPKGEHIGMQDILLDTIMGAALGPLFQTGSLMISRAGIRSNLRSTVDGMLDLLPDNKQIAEMRESLRTNNPEAYRAVGHKLEEMVDTRGRAQDAMDYVRMRLKAGDREEVARWMEEALNKVAGGEEVNMAAIMQTPEAQSTLMRVQNLLNEYRVARHETPVVVDTVTAARKEITTLADAAFKAENDFRQALNEGKKTGDLVELRQVSDDAKAIAGKVREVFAELDTAIREKTATEADIVRLAEKLLAARDDIRNKISVADVPRAHRIAGLWERAVQRAEDKLNELDATIRRETRYNPEEYVPISAERLDFSPAEPQSLRPVRSPVVDASLRSAEGRADGENAPLLSAENMSRAQEFTDAGIDMSHPETPGVMASVMERNLSEISPESAAIERAIMGEMGDLEAHTARDADINRRSKAVLEDTNLVECIMNAGALQ